jgi:hypothetical protein
MGWAGHVACKEKMRNAYKILVGKGKRPLKSTKRSWEDNIKMIPREIQLEGADCIHMAQIGTGSVICEHSTEYSGCIKTILITYGP